MKGKSSYDYTSNTNSLLSRNVIQAMAVGGVTDLLGTDPTLETSVNFDNLVRLEHAVQALKTPEWPAELSYDATLAERGKEVFQGVCAACHTPTPKGKGLYDVRVIPLEQIGTDDHVISQWLTPIKTPSITGNLGEISNAIIPKLVKRYCKEAQKSRSECLALDGTYDAAENPSGQREEARFTTGAIGYQADVLDGVWSYGRYLHNGSVPSVADLLEPTSERPKRFAVGHRLYDAERLGYVVYADLSAAAKKEGATLLFDVDQPGNSNAGHEGELFGTNLPSEDKRALLEYLKRHRSVF